MLSATDTRLAKLRALSRFGNVACLALMIVTVPVLCFLIVGGFTLPDATCDFGTGARPCAELGVGARALAFGLLMVGAALFLKVLFHLSRLFKNYAQGAIFTRDSVRQIRRIGSTVLILGAFQVAILVAAVALAGRGQISSGPIQVPFVPLVSGGLVMLVSWVMELGTELREESELTV